MDTHLSQMPAFGKDKLLSREEIEAVVDHVMFISGQVKADSEHGAQIFAQQCAACHGENGQGDREFGAPNLTDKIWLYGGDRHTVYETVYNARAGVMPAWKDRLDENTIRQLTIYIHQLGGGEQDDMAMEEEAGDVREREDNAGQL